MSFTGYFAQAFEIALALALAPALMGWVNQWRAWLQNKSAPSLWQPYRMLHKLFNKESMVADGSSPLFRTAPYVIFGCMVLAASIVPVPTSVCWSLLRWTTTATGSGRVAAATTGRWRGAALPPSSSRSSTTRSMAGRRCRRMPTTCAWTP